MSGGKFLASLHDIDPTLPPFLAGGGDMAGRIAAHDWSASLGTVDAWPQSLKTIVGLLVHSPVAMVLLWGMDGIMIYNDAYSVFAGDRHPRLLGSKVREGWPEVAAFNDHVMKTGLAGGTLSYKDQELVLNRRGTLEPAWMDLDYSPVIDESGKPGGVIAIVMEITERVLAERRASAEQQRQRQLFTQMPGFVGVLSGPEHTYEYVNQAYLTLAGDRDYIGKTVRQVFPDLAGQGFFELFDRVYASGEPFVARGMPIQLAGQSQYSFIDFVYEPIRDEKGAITGIFVGGYDVTEGLRAERRRIALAELGDTIRDIADPDAIAYAGAEMLGRTLGVSRAGYGIIDTKAETITIQRDWNAVGIQSLTGVLRFRDYGSYIEDLKRGETVICADAEHDPRTARQAEALKAISAQSFVNMPLTEDGGVVALLYLNHAEARDWPAEEISFIREAAERIRTAVERRRAESELRASENQFRTMAQAMPNHVWTAAPDGMLDWFNSQVYAYSGSAPGTLDGTAWTCIVHPDDIAAASANWSAALAAGETYETEFRLRRADGGYRWHIARAVPIRGSAGEVVRWIGTNTDIEDHKQAVEALRELNADLERKVIERTQARGLTWQMSPDLMGALNSEGYFETSNPAWQTVLGWSEAEVASMSIFELLHPDDVERTKAGFALTQQGQPAIQFPNRYRCKDGSYRWISWVGVPEDGMVYCSGRDITLQMEKEAQLAQTEEALRQAQKMEAVGQLTGGIAHDFNNLLQGITGALDRVQNRLAQGRTNDVDRFLKAAIDSANRAAALTHRLLAFSRRQTLDPRPVDANRLIGGMEDLIRRSMGPNVSIEVVGAGGLWPIRVDPSQLENSLLNLCINARDAMPGGGKLTIETANKWLDERAAKDRELPPGQYVSLCVTDTGTGMTPEVIARAFDPFFTTKPLGQGTGLGLSMIYGFVRQSGGQVRIYSETAQGTTMCLYFPRHLGQLEEEAPSADEMMERGFGETVLVVDDEPTVRMLIAEVLSESYYNIVEAGDGPSALKILESPKRIDLMITDVGLPGGMNGRQVADAARVMRKDLKVLFITGYAENAAIGNGQLDAGMEILAKPFAMSTLANKVREMIER